MHVSEKLSIFDVVMRVSPVECSPSELAGVLDTVQ